MVFRHCVARVTPIEVLTKLCECEWVTTATSPRWTLLGHILSRCRRPMNLREAHVKVEMLQRESHRRVGRLQRDSLSATRQPGWKVIGAPFFLLVVSRRRRLLSLSLSARCCFEVNQVIANTMGGAYCRYSLLSRSNPQVLLSRGCTRTRCQTLHLHQSFYRACDVPSLSSAHLQFIGVAFE